MNLTPPSAAPDHPRTGITVRTAPPPAGPLLFLREAARTFHTTGAIAPSGHSLACRLAQPLADRAGRAARDERPWNGRRQSGRPRDGSPRGERPQGGSPWDGKSQDGSSQDGKSQGDRPRSEGPQDGRPWAVLEAGAGTGTVTRVLAELLVRPGDRLDAVEVNPRFVRTLEGLRETDPAMAAAGDRIRLIPESITELDLGEHRYELIVSCLPFTNFTPETVETILGQYLRALTPGGHLTFFAYLGTRPLRALTGGRAEARRHRAVAALLDAFTARYGVGRHVVWDNVPPARVQHLRAP
ncbi:class I SAM-dependent methyltransferase [Streptomyces sp. CA-181903]|uniref:class I SAM-dependent methyltransferase n=1 Tax=Streptomyces sp. CA-181903 TaxID=3240055 RepID=UPI003D8BF334